MYKQTGLVPKESEDSGTLGVSEQIWWVAAGLAEAPGEVLLASGTLVPQSWLHHLERSLRALLHRTLHQVGQGNGKRLDPRWG